MKLRSFPSEERKFNWPAHLVIAAGTAISAVGLVAASNGFAEYFADRTRESCRALISTIKDMHPDETQRQQLCTNDLIKTCLADTSICPQEK